MSERERRQGRVVAKLLAIRAVLRGNPVMYRVHVSDWYDAPAGFAVQLGHDSHDMVVAECHFDLAHPITLTNTTRSE